MGQFWGLFSHVCSLPRQNQTLGPQKPGLCGFAGTLGFLKAATKWLIPTAVSSFTLGHALQICPSMNVERGGEGEAAVVMCSERFVRNYYYSTLLLSTNRRGEDLCLIMMARRDWKEGVSQLYIYIYDSYIDLLYKGGQQF